MRVPTKTELLKCLDDLVRIEISTAEVEFHESITALSERKVIDEATLSEMIEAQAIVNNIIKEQNRLPEKYLSHTVYDQIVKHVPEILPSGEPDIVIAGLKHKWVELTTVQAPPTDKRRGRKPKTTPMTVDQARGVVMNFVDIVYSFNPNLAGETITNVPLKAEEPRSNMYLRLKGEGFEPDIRTVAAIISRLPDTPLSRIPVDYVIDKIAEGGKESRVRHPTYTLTRALNSFGVKKGATKSILELAEEYKKLNPCDKYEDIIIRPRSDLDTIGTPFTPEGLENKVDNPEESQGNPPEDRAFEVPAWYSVDEKSYDNILTALAKNGPIRASGLASDVKLSNQAIRELTGNLVSGGYITSDSAENGSKIFEITLSGVLLSIKNEADREFIKNVYDFGDVSFGNNDFGRNTNPYGLIPSKASLNDMVEKGILYLKEVSQGFFSVKLNPSWYGDHSSYEQP